MRAKARSSRLSAVRIVPLAAIRNFLTACDEAAMALIGFHASHELFSPGELLAQVRLAETAGFAAAMCSDHFHPCAPDQGHSGYSFSWLGAALEATSISHGTICC